MATCDSTSLTATAAGQSVFADILHAIDTCPMRHRVRKVSRPEAQLEPHLLRMRTLRLRLMERLLRYGGVVSAARLRALTGASLATFKRDLEILRSEFGAEIVYDPAEGGYRLLNADWQGVIEKALHEINLA